jgi:putative FmdB family regulatory protein
MPLYEYECKECKIVFELLRRASDEDKGLTCPRCGAPDPSRLISSFCSIGAHGPAGGGGHSAPGHS